MKLDELVGLVETAPARVGVAGSEEEDGGAAAAASPPAALSRARRRLYGEAAEPRGLMICLLFVCLRVEDGAGAMMSDVVAKKNGLLFLSPLFFARAHRRRRPPPARERSAWSLPGPPSMERCWCCRADTERRTRKKEEEEEEEPVFFLSFAEFCFPSSRSRPT
jgi:hypothetical protein